MILSTISPAEHYWIWSTNEDFTPRNTRCWDHSTGFVLSLHTIYIFPKN